MALLLIQAFAGLAEPFRWEGARPSKGYEDRPVALVSLEDANACCQWLAETTGQAYRLPSKAETEYAPGDAWYKNRESKWMDDVGW